MTASSEVSQRRARLAVLLAALCALVAALLPATNQQAHAQPVNADCGSIPDPSVEGFIDHDQLRQRLEQIQRSSQGRVQVEVAGYSNHGREIWTARVGHGDRVVLVQSEIHGNEKHGTTALLNTLATLGNNSKRSRDIREAITFVAVPKMNPDGAELDTRRNAMPWSDVMALHPQLTNTPRAWYFSQGLGGFDVNRDFNPDLDYEPRVQDLPGSSSGVGFYITPAARTVREVYRSLEDEFGKVDVFLDLHNQAPCYTEGLQIVNKVTIHDGPAAGTYDASGASFGPDTTRSGISGPIAVPDDGSGNTLGCNPYVSFPAGSIALVDRGDCPFVQKVANAQAAGATAVIVGQSTSGAPTNMGGSDASITIPSVMVSRDDAATIRGGLPATGTVAENPEKLYWSHLSISGRFISNPDAHGDWPEFDYDASRRANLAVYDALQRGNSPFGKVTLYPQNTNLPGTALGSFALRGSAVVLFETSGQTQHIGTKRMGMLVKQVELGIGGVVDALTDGTFDELDPERYEDIPVRG